MRYGQMRPTTSALVCPSGAATGREDQPRAGPRRRSRDRQGCLIAPLKRAVGSWNFAEISPQEALGSFNEFRQSVVLRISEGKDLGDIDRFAFYDGTKS